MNQQQYRPRNRKKRKIVPLIQVDSRHLKLFQMVLDFNFKIIHLFSILMILVAGLMNMITIIVQTTNLATHQYMRNNQISLKENLPHRMKIMITMKICINNKENKNKKRLKMRIGLQNMVITKMEKAMRMSTIHLV